MFEKKSGKAPNLENVPKKKFFAIRNVTRETDNWPAYQIEVVVIQGGYVVDQYLYDKPDTLDMVMGKTQEFLHPELEGVVNEEPPIGA